MINVTELHKALTTHNEAMQADIMARMSDTEFAVAMVVNAALHDKSAYEQAISFLNTEIYERELEQEVLARFADDSEILATVDKIHQANHKRLERKIRQGY